ncbi:MAG: hypothetical protein ACFBSE_14460 [Prochloraceae cyanobacterium]
MSLFSTSAVGETNSWAKLALQDLAAIKTELQENHPGAVDPQNPQFAKWMREGYIEASQLAKTADSFGGYYFALRRYINRFNDKHLEILPSDGVKLENNFWPGFAVSLHNNQFIVSDLSDMELNAALAKLPQPGDAVIACDGKSVNQLFASNVQPFYGVEGLASDKNLFAPLLMFDEGNPYIQRPTRCTFNNRSSGKYYLNLNWQPITFDLFRPIWAFAFRGKADRPEIGLKQIDAGVFWITLSSFRAKEQEKLLSVIKTVKENSEALRSSDVIVFDVRRNVGGDSRWGEDLLKSIWGEGFVERLPGGGALAVDWRVSKSNIKAVKENRSYLANIRGEDSDEVREHDDIIAGMKRALKHGDKYYRQSIGFVSDQKAIRKGEIAPKIYLLSDGACGSSCLNFADLVLSIPNAELIGTETSADTEYIENRIFELPSNKINLFLSMKVIRGRVRGSNQPYRPTHEWNGNSWDTEDLQDWVLELSAE